MIANVSVESMYYPSHKNLKRIPLRLTNGGVFDLNNSILNLSELFLRPTIQFLYGFMYGRSPRRDDR